MPHHRDRKLWVRLCLTFISPVFLAVCPCLAQLPTQEKDQQILPLKDVRIGMKGYGLTVFQGTKIEPFSVEVVAVMRDFTPQKGVIWIRCPDERMQILGPVQGMSGSPIYLWPNQENQNHKIGEGGLLIGAFALGFSNTKDCYVGVQPIEQMRQAAARARSQPDPSSANSAPTGHDRLVLQQVMDFVGNQQSQPTKTWRSQAILKLFQQHTVSKIQPQQAHTQQLSIPPHLEGEALRIKLPMAVGSPELAGILAPVLSPLGLAVVSSNATMAGTGSASNAIRQEGAVVGTPPPEIDVATIRFQPGGVLSIPFAFGDLDLSAIGTVTDVRPDGTVLGFGHGMFSQGPLAVPMATGYVHLIMPAISSSFKLGGSGVIRGSIVRDEHSAVIGMPSQQFKTAPIDITIHRPDNLETLRYHYEVVHHRRLTPFIASAVVLRSITAQSNLPLENTVRLHGTIRFQGNRTLDLDSTLADASLPNMLTELLPVITAMMQNPHEPMALESLQLTVDIDPSIRAGSIVSAQIDRVEAAPGDTLGITVQIQPYGKRLTKYRIEFPLPQELTDGDYELTVCDARTYLQLLFDDRPHMLATTNADEWTDTVQRVLSIANDALYTVLELPDPGLAIGHQELPQLPSSRRALFDTPTNTLATTYTEWVEQVTPIDLVPDGKIRFTIKVQKTLAE